MLNHIIYTEVITVNAYWYACILHSIIRCCNEECVVKDVHFSKGVSALIAVTTVHSDPELWVEPQLFNPERLATFLI